MNKSHDDQAIRLLSDEEIDLVIGGYWTPGYTANPCVLLRLPFPSIPHIDGFGTSTS